MKKRVSIELAIILIWPIIASIISFLIKPNAFISVVLFLAIPSLYLAYKGREYVKKAAIFSLIAGVLIMFVIDYISHLTGAWNVPNTILPFRLFNFVTIEVILWAFFTCFFVVMFYEYFIDKHCPRKLVNAKMKYLLIAGLILFLLFAVLFFAAPKLLYIPYWYLVFGVLLTLGPFLVQLFKYPKTTSKFFLAAAYFFYLHFLAEVVSLKLGYWTFPGSDFIGWISIFGVSFPIEEVIFWFILLSLAILSYYEYFDDDEK